MSDTPRTDAVSHGGSYAGVAGDLHRLARTLERELTQAHKDVAQYERNAVALREYIHKCHDKIAALEAP